MSGKKWLVTACVTSAVLLLASCAGDEPIEESSALSSAVSNSVSSAMTSKETSSFAGSADTSSAFDESISEESVSATESEDSVSENSSSEQSVPSESFTSGENSIGDTSDPAASTEPEESTDPTESSDTESEVSDPSGTQEEPYIESPGEDQTVTTVSIPSGKTVLYSIYRVGGMVLTVKDADAYVVYDGTRYEPVNGVLTIHIENALASDAIDFEIGNSGSKAKSFDLFFEQPLGNYGNPVIVSDIKDKQVADLEEGNEVGCFYRYVATEDGTLRLYMSATADSILVVTNNRNSAQRTTESDGQTDESGRSYVEISVQKGDELVINVGAIPNRRGKYPASEITWSGEYQ